MTRTLLLTLLVLALSPAAVLAQDAEAPAGGGAAQVDPDTPVADGDGAAGDEDDAPGGPDDGPAEDACERGGADADYTYCADDTDCIDGADDDYIYDVECYPAAGGDEDGPGGGDGPAARALPASELPLTGGEPLVIALFGAAFVLLGAGLRPRGAART